MFKYLLIIVVLLGLLISSCKSSTTYSISGKITGDVISGVNIKLTTFQGAKIADTTTDSSGNYSFSKINKGDYYVSPNLTDKQCSPPLQTINVSDSNITGIDFKITTPTTTYTISGKITLSGSGLQGVGVALSGAEFVTATTDSSGNYSCKVSKTGSYTITPGKAGYTFTPTNSTKTISTTNISDVNFTATAVP